MNTLEIINELKRNNVFPSVIGDQLKLSGETRQLSTALIEQIKQAKSELITFLSEPSGTTFSAPIPQVAQQEAYMASNAQQRIWTLGQFEGGTEAYNIVTSLYLKGTVHAESLDRAFQMAILRHESLRTVFKVIDGELFQVIRDEMDFTIHQQDISREGNIPQFLLGQIATSSKWSFDLENGPLLKVSLFKISEDASAMIFGVHHIISDGWSINILISEVLRNYAALCNQETPGLEPLRIQYKDYTYWVEGLQRGDPSKESQAFWKNEAKGRLQPLELPYDFARPGVMSHEGQVSKHYFDGGFYENILLFCKKHHVTLFNFFRATLNILLAKYSGQDTVVVGTPVSGRIHYDLENQIGMYINTLPLISHLDFAEPFVNAVKKVTESSLRAMEYQHYPLDQILEDLEVRRDPSRNPLFDVMMVLQDTAIGTRNLNAGGKYGFDINYLDVYLRDAGYTKEEKRPAKCDLTFNFDSEAGNVHFLELEYATQLFKKETISQLFDTYIFIITQVLENPQITLRDIQLVTPANRHQLLTEFNQPVLPFEETSIYQLLHGVFQDNKDQPAILFENEEVSYERLAQHSGQVTACLDGIRNVPSEAMVGLLMERSSWTVATILGILKTGRAYVPIDPNYPEERIDYIVRDAALSYIIADDKGNGLVPQGYTGTVIHLEEVKNYALTDLDEEPPQDYLDRTAYLIYTSGSTGKPKGVQITQKNAIAFLKWGLEEFRNTPYTLAYAATSYCFDLSIFEFLLPLCQGRAIRVLPSALEIPNYVDADQNILINTVPSVVRNLLDIRMDWGNVVALNMAGETIPKTVIQEVAALNAETRNLYGPSEDTTYSTVYRFTKEERLQVPIGKPVGFTQLYILDACQNLLPIGVPGEIYLGGHCVAKGYLNRAELTAKRFVENPFLPGTVMYKTGDIGKWLPDGNVSFLGRNDDQVKIRGNRIELGEVQYVMEGCPGVKEAFVTVIEENVEKELVAYWVAENPGAKIDLKEYLGNLLPGYMLPTHYVELPLIPLNSNGKVDKRQLPKPQKNEKGEVERPQDEMQRQLMNLWQEVLEVQNLGITDNFFDLGGHSLKATKLKYLVGNRLSKTISLDEIFAHPTIKAQAVLLQNRVDKASLALPRVAEKAHYPLSFSQERLWVLANFEEASKAYNMPAAFQVEGVLDVQLMTKACRMVIERHEILRTVFKAMVRQPVQEVLPASAIEFEIKEIELTQDLEGAALAAFLQEKWQTAFDLQHGPLLEGTLLKMPHSQIFSFNVHHMVSDGWSMGVLYNEVMKGYRGLSISEDYQVPGLSFQYKDYAAWQRSQFEEGVLEKELAYWKDTFQDGVPVLELPTDFYRPDIKTYNGQAFYHQFSPALTSRLKKLGGQHQASLFMVLMAGVNVLMKKYANQNEVVIGTPVSGREYQELEGQIGMYVNTLAIKTTLDGAMVFADLLEKQKEVILAGLENQHIPFEMLIEELGLQRDLSRSPLFDVMVVLQNASRLDGKREIAEGVTFDRLSVPSGTAKYDLNFSFTEQPAGLSLELEYNAGLYRPATIRLMVSHLESLLAQVTEDPQCTLKDIRLLGQEEYKILSSKADKTAVAYDKTANIVSLFQKAVQRFPGHIAVTYGDTHMTYRELDIKSSQLARDLIHNYHVANEDLVGLHFERTESMLVAILGVLKAGAAYVPIDPTYPSARIDYIIEDSATKVILYDTVPQGMDKPAWEGKHFLHIEEAEYSGTGEVAPISPGNLAYVIYTSGTTGNPKGVLIEHENVTRLLFNDEHPYDFNENDRWPLFHSYCFDVSVWEMYGALLNGGALIVVPKATAQDSINFYDFLHDNAVTILNQTPTAFRSLSQNNKQRFSTLPLSKIRYLIFAGEALAPEILKPWHAAMPACKLINMYGITETTVHVTYKEITQKEIVENRSLIGDPLPTLSCYVLDMDLQQVPIGVIGELCVGGAGLARGYLNKPGLTADRFIEHPNRQGERLYRSGDYARVLESGEVEYIGRKDEQVKIRGHRIEIAEIETAISKQEYIKDVVVIPIKNKHQEYDLVAYYIIDQHIEADDLRLALHKILPSYMVPSYLVSLPAFPLNRNGKLDKAALPKPEMATERKTDHKPARNETDQQIIGMWEEVLDISPIGIEDNFFDLGGHSLKATRVLAKLHETYGIKIDLKDLFQDPTVRHLSDYVETMLWMKDQEATVGESEDEILF